ncbi:MAG: phosphotransferase, partial [Anaerolineae bacterium]|nr:phosphotransferase [Anaerolineae bacterium]
KGLLREYWPVWFGEPLPARLSFAQREKVLFAFPEDAQEPSLVIKLARTVQEGARLEREHTLLASLHRSFPQLARAVPSPLLLGSLGRRPFLIETALVGRPWLALFRERHPHREAPLEQVLSWLWELQRATSRRAPLQRQYVAKLLAIAPFLREESPHLVLAIERLWQSFTEREGSCPMVWSHGDLQVTNIFLLPQGSIGIIDWEEGSFERFPHFDFFYLLWSVYSLYLGLSPADAWWDLFIEKVPWGRVRISRWIDHLGLLSGYIPFFSILFLLEWIAMEVQFQQRLFPWKRGKVIETGSVEAWRKLAEHVSSFQDLCQLLGGW